MKSFYRNVFVVFFVLLLGCQQQQRTFTEVEKEAIKKEVKDQFNQLISACNQSKHVFTMIWKKEQGGWKILHSHESWVDEQVK